MKADIKLFPNYTIFTDGRVFNNNTNNFLKGSIGGSGYMNFRLKDIDGEYKTIGLHRLLALAFIKHEVNTDGLVVNHKDGNKLNNSLENLEWVTYRENLLHAGRNGLTSKCVPMITINAETLEVKRFPSMVDCAEYLSVTKDLVSYRLRFSGRRVFPDGLMYMTEEYEEEALELLREGRLKDFGFGRGRRSLVKDLVDGNIIEYPTTTDLANFFGVTLSATQRWLDEGKQKIVQGRYMVKYKDDHRPWRKVTDIKKDMEDASFKVRVYRKANDGTVKEYDSAKKCAEDNNLKTTTLNHRLKSKGNKVFKDGFKYGYL